MKRSAFGLVVLLLAGVAYGQEGEQEIRLASGTTCFTWMTLSNGIRGWYLKGATEALASITDKNAWETLYFPGASIAKVGNGVTQLCSDYKNYELPIYIIWKAVAMGVRGTPEQEVEEYLEIRRKVFSEMPNTWKETP